MSWHVVIAQAAAREIESQYDFIAKHSKATANRWRDALLKAIDTLADDPERCPEAPEAEWHEGLRQLVHGRRRQVHRLIFEIRGKTVVVLRVRHAAQDLLKSDEF
jgi:plasmid stabilization system protein ParE